MLAAATAQASSSASPSSAASSAAHHGAHLRFGCGHHRASADDCAAASLGALIAEASPSAENCAASLGALRPRASAACGSAISARASRRTRSRATRTSIGTLASGTCNWAPRAPREVRAPRRGGGGGLGDGAAHRQKRQIAVLRLDGNFYVRSFAATQCTRDRRLPSSLVLSTSRQRKVRDGRRKRAWAVAGASRSPPFSFLGTLAPSRARIAPRDVAAAADAWAP